MSGRLRHELTGRARLSAAQLITSLPPERRERLHGALPEVVRRLGVRAYERGPVMVDSGLGAGLLISTPDIGLDHAHAGLFLRGTLEPPVQEAMRRRVAPGGVVYDVGANIGFFTLLAARLVGSEGRVLGFEPLPDGARAVRNGVTLNGFDDRADVREVAVGAQDGTARLLVVGEGSWSHLSTTGRHPDVTAELDVEIVTLDAVVAAGAPAPTLIKIDVEGAETDVLAGARTTLAEHAPDVICELHGTNAAVCDALEELGYAIVNLDGPEPVRDAGPVHLLAQRR